MRWQGNVLIFGVLMGSFRAPAQGTAQGVASAGAARIPELRGTTFAGEKVELPGALKGRAGVLVLGFSESARTEVAGWGKRLASDPGGPAGLLYFELPMVEEVPRLLRGLVLKAIRKEVSGEGRRHFLPVEEHEAEWKQTVGFGKADDAYVLLVDGDGVVRARMQGEVTPDGFSALQQKAGELLRAK